MPRPKRQSPSARRIKAALAQKGITQTEIAEKLGLHKNTVCGAINHGLNEPTLRRIQDLISAA